MLYNGIVLSVLIICSYAKIVNTWNLFCLHTHILSHTNTDTRTQSYTRTYTHTHAISRDRTDTGKCGYSVPAVTCVPAISKYSLSTCRRRTATSGKVWICRGHREAGPGIPSIEFFFFSWSDRNHRVGYFVTIWRVSSASWPTPCILLCFDLAWFFYFYYFYTFQTKNAWLDSLYHFSLQFCVSCEGTPCTDRTTNVWL